MGLADYITSLTEDDLAAWIERYRSYGPLPGILITFAKSFIPPLPTMLIVGVNAAVYGLWLGFLYSLIGIVGGCLVTFLIIRRIAGHPWLERWMQKPKVERSLEWIRCNGFSYVFLLSLFPVGPFVFVNMVAAVARMRVWSFLIAILFGKAVMVLSVSLVGHDIGRFIEHPVELVYVLLFIGVSLYFSKKIERRFANGSTARSEANDGNDRLEN